MTKQMASSERSQPIQSDPEEQAIRLLIDSEFSTKFSKNKITKFRQDQLSFIANAIKSLRKKEGTEDIRESYLTLLSNLASTTIVKSGKEIAKDLPPSGFIVATNHLAMPKATRFNRQLLGEIIKDQQLLSELPEEIEPFPIRHAAIATTLGSQFNPHEIAIELPSPYKDVQSVSGVVTLPSDIGGRFEIMVDRVKGIFRDRENQYVITYPESGTTGKRGNGGLYGIAQEDFHTGFVRLALTLQQQLFRQIPIIIVGQIFHPEQGFMTGVLNPITINVSSNESELKQSANGIQLQLNDLVHQLRFDS